MLMITDGIGLTVHQKTICMLFIPCGLYIKTCPHCSFIIHERQAVPKLS